MDKKLKKELTLIIKEVHDEKINSKEFWEKYKDFWDRFPEPNRKDKDLDDLMYLVEHASGKRGILGGDRTKYYEEDKKEIDELIDKILKETE